MSSPQLPIDPEVMATRLNEELARMTKSLEVGTQIANGKINVPTGMTPKEQIWALNKTTLFHYHSPLPKSERKPVPLLLVFALINRSYIYDLRPGNSFVEYLLSQGYDVYVIDWGTPGLEDAHYNFEDYALNFLPRAIRAMQRHYGSREFSLLGWCIGATLVTLYAAVRPEDGLKNLILLTPPLDFSDKQGGTFSRWLNTENYNVDLLVKQFGNVPSEIIEYGSKMLKPVENYILNYLKLWDNLDNPAVVESWLAMNKWVTDNVPFPGAAFRQWVVEFYRENRLMEGKLVMAGQVVELGKIKANLLSVIADKDHIVPTCQSEGAFERIGSEDKYQLRLKGGHIGVMVGSGASKRCWPEINRWLGERSL